MTAIKVDSVEAISEDDVADSFWSFLDTLSELKIISEDTNDALSKWHLFEAIFEHIRL